MTVDVAPLIKVLGDKVNEPSRGIPGNTGHVRMNAVFIVKKCGQPCQSSVRQNKKTDWPGVYP